MSSAVQDLLQSWRHRATELQPYAPAAARAFEDCAAELERTLQDRENELLNLRAAARESGYDEDYLGELVRTGRIPNAGRPGAPKIRRRDLPRKATAIAQQARGAHLRRVSSARSTA